MPELSTSARTLPAFTRSTDYAHQPSVKTAVLALTWVNAGYLRLWHKLLQSDAEKNPPDIGQPQGM
jgi:hypothetical protein